MKTTNNKNKNSNDATATLAQINAQIEALNAQRIGLAQPLKDRYTELNGELVTLQGQIRELDPVWKPASLKPKADVRIAEVIAAHGSAMTDTEIITAVGDLFTPWKVKNTLKKKSIGAKAVFTVADGKYDVKVA